MFTEAAELCWTEASETRLGQGPALSMSRSLAIFQLDVHASLILLCFITPPSGGAVAQCPKENSRNSGVPHEAMGIKRTYDMMEGRGSRGLSGRELPSASIEGGLSQTMFHIVKSNLYCLSSVALAVFWKGCNDRAHRLRGEGPKFSPLHLQLK